VAADAVYRVDIRQWQGRMGEHSSEQSNKDARRNVSNKKKFYGNVNGMNECSKVKMKTQSL